MYSFSWLCRVVLLYIYLSDTVTGQNPTVYAILTFSEQFYVWDLNTLFTLGRRNINVRKLTHIEGLAFCAVINSAAACVPTAADFLR